MPDSLASLRAVLTFQIVTPTPIAITNSTRRTKPPAKPLDDGSSGHEATQVPSGPLVHVGGSPLWLTAWFRQC